MSRSPYNGLTSPKPTQTANQQTHLSPRAPHGTLDTALRGQVVEATTRITASKENEFQRIFVRAVPGTSAAKEYVCLGSSASPTTYSWVEVASG